MVFWHWSVQQSLLTLQEYWSGVQLPVLPPVLPPLVVPPPEVDAEWPPVVAPTVVAEWPAPVVVAE
jgi:hypothetical protein